MVTNRICRLAMVAAVVCAFTLGTAARAGTEYFFATANNRETGGVAGTNDSGNPKGWTAVHSQLNGSCDPEGNLRLGDSPNANWTFIWTRAQDDHKAYTVTPKFQLRKEYAGRVALEAGFDPVYHHTQIPWPQGYWVSNDTLWCLPLDTTEKAPGTYEINAANKTLVFPAEMKKMYLRLRLLDGDAHGFTFITGGNVSFSTQQAGNVMAPKLSYTNMAEMGADSTGGRDATELIQRALDQGGTIYFPSGTYTISKTLVIRNSYTKLQGENASIIKVAAGSPVTGIITSQAESGLHDIEIAHLTLLNDPANYKPGDNLQGTQGIALAGVTDARVEDCVIKNFQHEGIGIGTAKNVTVTGCQVQGARHGITANGNYYNVANQSGNWNIQISNCRVADTWDTGIIAGFGSSYVTINNCIIERSWCHGIDIFNTSHVTVSGCIVRNWNAPKETGQQTPQSVGIFVHPDWGVSTYIPTRDITLTGNLVIYDQPLPVGITPNCIEVVGHTDTVAITGNQLVGGYRGFFIREQPYDQFYQARVDKRDESGIPMAPQNVIFNNNVCRGQTGDCLGITSSIPMPCLIAENIFAPGKSGKITLSYTGKQAAGIVVRGNTFRCDALLQRKPPVGMTWEANSCLPSANTPASEEFRAK